jgi:hypothetical protein
VPRAADKSRARDLLFLAHPLNAVTVLNRSLSSTAVAGCVESVLPIVFAFDAMCVSFEKWIS